MRGILESLVLKTAYPGVMIGTVASHFFMIHSGWSITASTYIPFLTATVCIIVLEQLYPFHAPWLPNKQDIKNDFFFLFFIQFGIPKLILYSALLLVSQSGFLFIESLRDVWPRHWHPVLQAVIMIVVVDFSIYWVHRFMHMNRFLWRYHSVHHTPKKLYWLNVGRDHPLEKTLLFSFGLLPFYLIGVDAEVLGIYIVIFDTHAFFQHSNINIKYGFLNYLISTSELHRWHHSQVMRHSQKNFGNTLSVWDVLFGTWYFPYASYYNIGISEKDYPTGFFQLMKSTFFKGIDVDQLD